MVGRMFFQDVLIFIAIYAIFMLGFATVTTAPPFEIRSYQLCAGVFPAISRCWVCCLYGSNQGLFRYNVTGSLTASDTLLGLLLSGLVKVTWKRIWILPRSRIQL